MIQIRKNLIVIVVLFPTLLYGQKIATTFQDAIDDGVSIEKLDQTYQSALHSDSSKAAFRGQEKEFYDGYISMLKELSQYLKENNFKWGKTTRCFNKIYLNNNGEIDYFLFNFKPGEIDNKKEEEFKRLLGKFIQKYRFPLINENKFAQCSPVTYMDN